MRHGCFGSAILVLFALSPGTSQTQAIFQAVRDGDESAVHFGIVTFLVEQGARLQARDEDGDTPLVWAANAGHLHVTEMLLGNGAALDELVGNVRPTLLLPWDPCW